MSFGNVQVRQYEVAPSVGIGWKYSRGGTVHVNDFEKMQRGEECEISSSSSMRRKKGAELCILPRPIRETMLREWGYTPKEIAESTRQNLRIKIIKDKPFRI